VTPPTRYRTRGVSSEPKRSELSMAMGRAPTVNTAGKIPPNPLLAIAGLSLAQIDNSDTRVSVQSQIKLLELAGEALDDDLLGFRLAKACEPRQLGLLYYVIASSETLAEALAKAERYGHIANEGVAIAVREGRGDAVALAVVGGHRARDARVEEKVAVAPTLLGLVHRGVREAQQPVAVRPVFGEDGRSDARRHRGREDRRPSGGWGEAGASVRG